MKLDPKTTLIVRRPYQPKLRTCRITEVHWSKLQIRDLEFCVSRSHTKALYRSPIHVGPPYRTTLGMYRAFLKHIPQLRSKLGPPNLLRILGLNDWTYLRRRESHGRTYGDSGTLGVIRLRRPEPVV